MYCRLGDFALRLKKRPNGLQSSKRLDKQSREAQRGEKIKHLNLKLGFQLQCLMVSPWGITHPLGISMEAMDATWPWLWRRLYYSLMTWPSCGLSGGMRFSLTSKDIRAWYAPIPSPPPPFLFFVFVFVFTSLWLFVRLLTLFFQVVQVVFRVEEITNYGYWQLDDERTRRVAAVKSFNIVDQSNKDLRKKLKEEEQARRSTDSALEGAQK